MPAGVKFTSLPRPITIETLSLPMQNLAGAFLFGHKAAEKHVQGRADQEVNNQAEIDPRSTKGDAVPGHRRQDRHNNEVDQVPQKYCSQRPLKVRKRHAYFF